MPKLTPEYRQEYTSGIMVLKGTKVGEWDCPHAVADGENSRCNIVEQAKRAGVSSEQLYFVMGSGCSLPLKGCQGGNLCCGYSNAEKFGRRRCMGALASPKGVGCLIDFARKGERIFYVEKQEEFASVFGLSGLDWFIKGKEISFNLEGSDWKSDKTRY